MKLKIWTATTIYNLKSLDVYQFLHLFLSFLQCSDDIIPVLFSEKSDNINHRCLWLHLCEMLEDAL